MRNGKNPLVWLATIVMILVIAFILVVAEGIRRKAQKDRPGGPVPRMETPHEYADEWP